MRHNTYRNRSVAQKVKIIVFTKQVYILMICFKSFSAHYEVAAKIFACKLNTPENEPSDIYCAKQNKSLNTNTNANRILQIFRLDP